MIQGKSGLNTRDPSAVCYEETSISPRSALYFRNFRAELMLEVEWSVPNYLVLQREQIYLLRMLIRSYFLFVSCTGKC
jgi:hypothetical protein